jgi:hypothetical protein
MDYHVLISRKLWVAMSQRSQGCTEQGVSLIQCVHLDTTASFGKSAPAQLWRSSNPRHPLFFWNSA